MCDTYVHSVANWTVTTYLNTLPFDDVWDVQVDSESEK